MPSKSRPSARKARSAALSVPGISQPLRAPSSRSAGWDCASTPNTPGRRQEAFARLARSVQPLCRCAAGTIAAIRGLQRAAHDRRALLPLATGDPGSRGDAGSAGDARIPRRVVGGAADDRVGGSASKALQRRGLIQYRRGQITIADRAGLEEAACECYAAIEKHFRAVLPDVKEARGRQTPRH